MIRWIKIVFIAGVVGGILGGLVVYAASSWESTRLLTRDAADEKAAASTNLLMANSQR